MSPVETTQCPKCRHTVPSGTLRCGICQTVISSENVTLLTGSGHTFSEPVADPAVARELMPGAILSGRYEILQTLGQGGMGAVYKARDLELDRVVAIKVIRAELSGDAKSLQRFKQEMILARQITHKNVVRIFDLGTHEGLKYITMEFLEGRDLGSHMEERRFTPEQSAQVMRQVCRALEAAHGENVVHRDLKPQNIMVDEAGRVRVMDFGLARSVEMSGLTQTGAVLGTPAYMSPEQVKGTTADHRSDLFSAGVIFYELLTGKVPFQADTVWSTLLRRTEGPPPPPSSIDAAVPQPLNDIVMKCLAVDPAQRYQSAEETAEDLEAWLGDRASASVVMTATQTARARPAPRPSVPAPAAGRKTPKWRTWILVSVCLAVMATAGFVVWRKMSSAVQPRSPVTVLLADFSNHTGDAVFDGTLEPMLRMAVEGAGFINAYDRTQLRNFGAAPLAGRMDELTARQTAVRHGIGVVISGSVNRQGAAYVLSVRATRSVTGETIATTEATAPTKDQILFAVTKVATAMRKAMGDDTSESSQRFAMDTLTATSLEAVHEYSQGMESISNGKFAEARESFSKAADLDPNFGLAYAGMATASRNLGQLQEAATQIKLAIAHIDRMTERERFRTRGLFYAMTGDHQKCVDEYGALISRYSYDVAAHNNLGVCYGRLRKWPEAIHEFEQAALILPKRAVYRFNLAQYRAYAGDFEGAERELRAARQLNPDYEKGMLTQAYTELGRGRLTQAAQTYENLGKLSPAGASLAAAGLADLAVYEGRFSQAAAMLEKSAAADLAARKPDAAASKFALLAYVQTLRQQSGPAVTAAEAALSRSKSVKIRFLAGRAFVAAGQAERARALARGLGAELESEPQAYGKLLEGEAALKQGDPRQAIKLFTDANGMADTWIGRFDLGRAYLEAQAFAEADSEFDHCIQRRGEALEFFMDDVPTYGHFPAVLYYQGRVREGLKSPGFAASYRQYLGIRGKAAEDPLLPDVRKRAGI